MLFPENFNVSRDEVEGNIEIRSKQNLEFFYLALISFHRFIAYNTLMAVYSLRLVYIYLRTKIPTMTSTDQR